MACVLLTLCFLLTLTDSTIPDTRKEEIRIGAIFSLIPGRALLKTPEEITFQLAIDKVNADHSLLPGKRLRGFVEKVDPEEDYDNIQIANKLLELGVVVLIGPMNSAAIPAIGPMTSLAHVPQILPLTSLDTSSLNQNEYSYLLRMSPTEKLKAKVLVDIVRRYRWKKMAVLGLRGDEYKEYSQGKNAFRILATENEWEVPLDRLFPPHNKKKWKINPGRDLDSLSRANLRVVIVFCPHWAVKELLFVANRKKLINEWAWVFSDLGQSDQDLIGPSNVMPPYMRGLLGLRASVGKGAEFQGMSQAFKKEMASRNRPTIKISASVGNVYDSVLVAAQGIHNTLEQGTTISTAGVSVGFCSQSKTVKKGGTELYQNIKKVTMDGAMSDLSFEEIGEPRCANFDVMNLRKNGSVKLGEWTTEKNLQMINGTEAVWMSGKTKVPFDIPNFLRNKTIKIVAVLAPPFVMEKKSSSGDTNGTEYEGLNIDMLEHIRKALGFRYKLYLTPDGHFGSRNKLTGKWNGVMREVINKEATLSIAPLTISSDGQTVVDFTHPYMTFGVAFVMRVNDVEENYFRFLTPYHRNLWISICGMIVIMGLVLWVFSILSPFGYYGRYAQHPNKLKVKREYKQSKNTFSFVNAIWSSFLCYLNQGGQQPASLSGKIAVSVFWFAIMIINATYTANLAAHLTVSRMQTPIETVEDLAHQTTIEYGTLMNSQLQNFFLKTDVPRFLVMGQFMEQRKTWMPDIQKAIDRVMNSNFAFISDRPILEFIARKKEYCGKLKVIGGFGNTYGYGFALPLNSPITNLFNMEIFRLQRDLVIDSLKHKWTSKERCEMIDKMEEQSGKGGGSHSIQRVSLYDMLGVFVFMAIGIALGWVLMIVEWNYASIRDTTSREGPKTFCEAIALRVARVCKDLWCKKKTKQEPDDTDDEAQSGKENDVKPRSWAVLRAKEDDVKEMRNESNGSLYDVDTYEVSL